MDDTTGQTPYETTTIGTGPSVEPCPTCGHCPTCGRGPVFTYPHYTIPSPPFPTSPPYTPWWDGTIIVS